MNAVVTKLIGISGSLRRGSFNTALLRAAAEFVPDDAELTIETIHGIPLYDADVETADGIPERVAALKEAIVAADGLLLATPEYNNSMPGVPVALRSLAVGEETLRNNEVKIVLGARHRDIEQTPLLGVTRRGAELRSSPTPLALAPLRGHAGDSPCCRKRKLPGQPTDFYTLQRARRVMCDPRLRSGRSSGRSFRSSTRSWRPAPNAGTS